VGEVRGCRPSFDGALDLWKSGLRKGIDDSPHIPKDSDRAAVAARIRQLPF